MSDAEVTRTLLEHMLEMLRFSPAVDRVESQLLLFNAGEFASTFAGPQFTIHPRLFLECDLGRANAAQTVPGSGASPDLELSAWVSHDYQAAGELIYASYVGHADAEINDQYRTLHGSLRFLHNIVRFPGCGVFDPAFSWMLRDKRSRALVGMVLCSRVSADVGHITQLCIAKNYRGRGLGHLLLNRAAETLHQARFKAITLTVTEANQPAVRLYESFGFSLKHRFDAMAMDTRQSRR
jgi:ribosomal protein S18 acetylase RimI-like enzyme